MNKLRCEKRVLGMAFLAAMITGMITHSFAMNNTIYNYDSIAVNPNGYGVGLYSGRWALELMEKFAKRNDLLYNLPYMNGLVFLFLLAVSAVIVVAAFRISSGTVAAFVGMLFVVFPSVTTTMLFAYTVIPYGFSVLAAVAAAWLLRRCRYGLPVSALLMAFSMGVYQAYIPMTITMLVMFLIQDCLQGESPWAVILKRGIYYCIAIALGAVLYFGILNVMLDMQGMVLTNYQDINNMGKIPLGEIPALLVSTFLTFCRFPLDNYCGISHTPLLRLIYLLLLAASGIGTIVILWKKPCNAGTAVLTGLLFLAFPVAVNFIGFMCPGSRIYTIMIYSFALVPCLPLLIYEQLPEGGGRWPVLLRKLTRDGLGLLIALLVFLNAYYANVNYTAMSFANQQMETYVTSIITQVRSTEGFDTDKQWALIGTRNDPSHEFWWQPGLIYGGTTNPDFLMSPYSAREWFIHYAGYPFPEVDFYVNQELAEHPEVKAMPCWPQDGSIKVIDNYIVIKFQELSN